ncbi:DEAD/DEAH box helicase family protein [Corynebacterium sp. SCR221107]|uniref:DEAD/DEAH box helicase n=1 Tax=Corynebacterium sp. SCR221107 TaxID=3017361 RepID=UPI0022EC3A62|nr:DEAD/DEAH box helicase [Corynebacterium sp. SCR221107]WBT08708.1 DEAD/DEAH box helicase family protein [Corynebacterium sp. SCR221107]
MIAKDELIGEVAQLRAALDQLKLKQVELEERIKILEAGLRPEPLLELAAGRHAPAAGAPGQKQLPPSPPINSHSSSAEKIALFRSRFSGRKDVYAYAWEWAEKNKKGWSPRLVEGRPVPLTDDVIARHLTGGSRNPLHIGLYVLLADDNCRLLACDFDDKNWQENARSFAEAADNHGLDPLIEVSRSGEGAHVWIFFSDAVSAHKARVVGMGILQEAMRNSSLDFSSFDRFFPAQDTLPSHASGKARYGNLIALPLQGDRRREGRTVFVDPMGFEPYPDQFAALAEIKPSTPGELHKLYTHFIESGNEPGLPAAPTKATLRGLAKGNAGTTVRIHQGAQVSIDISQIDSTTVVALKRLAAIHNPEFYRRQAQRLSTYGTPRLIVRYEQIGTQLKLPRGCFEEALEIVKTAGYKVQRRTLNSKPAGIDVEFTGVLRSEQRRAVEAMLEKRTGILKAAPGMGKTVMACAIIARLGVRTAILVPKKELLSQWRERLMQFLNLGENDIGQVGAGKRKPGGKIDLVMNQSIARKDADLSFLDSYGLLIVDECHNVGAPGMEAALNQINVRNLYGLTATPYRSDGLDPLITMLCRPVRITLERDAASLARRYHIHETEFTIGENVMTEEGIAGVYNRLAHDGIRNQLLVKVTAEAFEKGENCLLLTNRVDHVKSLAAALRERDIPTFVLYGGQKSKEREETRKKLAEVDGFCLVAIDKVAGEGFDLPTLDTLVLAAPTRFKGNIIQQIGRITRDADEVAANLREANVHDFNDHLVPVLNNMFRKRRSVILKEGFVAG